MKKYFFPILLISILPGIAFGASARFTQLVREKQQKMEQLEKCMGASKGLKIAGVSTLGLTAVGVAGNIAEAKMIDSNTKTIAKNTEKIKTAQEDLDNAIKEKQQKTQQLESAMAQCNAKTFYEWKNGKCVLVDAAGECLQRGGEYDVSKKTCLCGKKEMKSYEQCKDGSASVLPIPEETEEENVSQLEVCSQEFLDSHNAKMGFWLKAEDDSMECFITKCKDGFHTTLKGEDYTVSSYKDFNSDVVCTADKPVKKTANNVTENCSKNVEMAAFSKWNNGYATMIKNMAEAEELAVDNDTEIYNKYKTTKYKEIFASKKQEIDSYIIKIGDQGSCFNTAGTGGSISDTCVGKTFKDCNEGYYNCKISFAQRDAENQAQEEYTNELIQTICGS